MRVWTVHRRRRGMFREDDVAFVPERFSWWALLFTWVWALANGLWLVAVLLLAGDIAIGVASDLLGLHGAETAVLRLGWGALVGWHAQDLRRWTLDRRGYDVEAVICAEDRDRAEWRYFSEAAAPAATPRPTPGPRTPVRSPFAGNGA